jgi:hypothetical protein
MEAGASRIPRPFAAPPVRGFVRKRFPPPPFPAAPPAWYPPAA